MRYLKLFENRSEEIWNICRRFGIYDYTVNSDGSISAPRINLSNRRLSEFPLKFDTVSDSFFCWSNRLTTLEGAPKYIYGHFWCQNNKLTDLEHLPESRKIIIHGNPINSIAQHFIVRKDRHKIIELFNFSGVIQEGNRVILNRLEYVSDAYDIRLTDDMLREIAEYYTIIER